ncbi:MAG: DUF2490 domain-containing protein [Flavobacteriaceae bacterium]
MCSFRWYLFLVGFVLMPSLKAQENFTVFFQPQMAINYSVSNTYSHNFSLAHRGYLVKNGTIELEARQLDMIHFSKFDLRDDQSLAFGLQYRFRDIFGNKKDEIRLMQQFNFTKRPYVVRFGHRFRTEQRFTKDFTIHRFRYRFAIDFPLKGETVDIGEPYFAGGFENIWSLAKNSVPQYDARVNAQLGWRLQGGLKLQTGMEYRREDFTSIFPKNIVLLLVGMQLSL